MIRRLALLAPFVAALGACASTPPPQETAYYPQPAPAYPPGPPPVAVDPGFAPPAGARPGECYAHVVVPARDEWARVGCPDRGQGRPYPSTAVGPWGRPGYGGGAYAYEAGYGDQGAGPYGPYGWSGYGRVWPTPYAPNGNLVWPGKSPSPLSPAAPGY